MKQPGQADPQTKAGGQQAVKSWEVTADGLGVSLPGDENVLEIGSGG